MLFEIKIRTNRREELIDITSKVSECVEKSGVKEGIVIVYSPHTTGGIFINENTDPYLKEDLLDFLRNLVPKKIDFKHIEGNSDAHLKTIFVGNSQTLILSEGKLVLGTWQGIFFAEFDGPRNRTVYVKIFKI